MARSLSDQLEIEEREEQEERLGLGERLTPFERERLHDDPTRPVYETAAAAQARMTTYAAWLVGLCHRSRSIPVTAEREARPLAEGQP